MCKPKVLMLCGRSPRHLYVANRLCEAAHVVAIVQESGEAWTADKLKRILRPRHLARKTWRWLRDRRRYLRNREAAFFFDGSPPALHQPELSVEVPTVNHPGVVKLVEQHDPDIIAVFGTSLIRGPLLRLGRLGILNLHGGLSPMYRGADCTFWALYNGEPDQVGCTIHFIDEGIDTGELVAHICPSIEPDDDELSIFWRAVRDSADVYVQIIQRLGNGEALGARQGKKGRLYQVKDRGLRHEMVLRKRLANGLLRNVHLPVRVRWFAEQVQVPRSEQRLTKVT